MGQAAGQVHNQMRKKRTHAIGACIMYLELLHVWKKTSNGSDAKDNYFPTSTDFQTTTNVTARPNQASLFHTCILYFYNKLKLLNLKSDFLSDIRELLFILDETDKW